MNPNKFEDLTNQILSSVNIHILQTIGDDHNLIDQNLLDDSQKFVSLDRKSVKLKVTQLESTDTIDNRVKKGNDLDERMKKFAKNMKRQASKQRARHCDLHQSIEPIERAVLLNKIKEKISPMPPDVEILLKRDEAVFQQHRANIEKVNKLMEAVKGYNYVEASLPAADAVNESIAFLREVSLKF